MSMAIRGPEIFIVDDDASVREVLADLFGMEGYWVRTFSHGEQAWQAIASGARPAVIISDLWLPDMSGRQLIERLRASVYHAIPVVVVSGSGWSERFDCGADTVFRKPVEVDELMSAVDRLVARSGEAKRTVRPGGRSGRATAPRAT
jgi:CheY-like chemotaxis protein